MDEPWQLTRPSREKTGHVVEEVEEVGEDMVVEVEVEAAVATVATGDTKVVSVL
jgi:hypothetical protein